MRIPYVIDNQTHKMADVLNELLKGHEGKCLDIATAYFNVRGFRLLQDGLVKLGNFRLLIGDEPEKAAAVGLVLKGPSIKRGLWGDLQQAPFTEETLRSVEDLIVFLRRENIQVRVFEKGFLHAKCYLFYGDSPSKGWDRFHPVAAIVGSSNFTGPGLTSNKELNLTHKVVLSDEEVHDDVQPVLFPEMKYNSKNALDNDLELKRLLKSSVGARAIADLDEWFERQWNVSRDFKQELIDLLDASKFGNKEYTPYHVYIKAIFEYFKDDLDTERPQEIRSAVDLAEFQEDAVKKARKILNRYDGVLIADSVGLGKTWIGKKLLEDYAYHMRQKALVICPASLRNMWTDELLAANIPAKILSQEELGQEDFDSSKFGDADVVLVDESHNFRNSGAQRYEKLSELLNANARRGKDGMRKKIILLSATPINNSIFDLYNQIILFTGNDKSYFASAGIGDLYRYFLAARRETRDLFSGIGLFNLLEEVVVRRTRPFIRKAYPKATIKGKPVQWPERKLRTVQYDLEAVYEGIYEGIVSQIENLRLAPYSLESYKKEGVEKDLFEMGREEALVGIFKSRYLKRFESSIEAFRISVRRALEFIKTFESYVLDGKVLDSASFAKATRFLSNEDEEDDATPKSRADQLDANEEAREFLNSLPTLEHTLYDLRKLHDALQADVDALNVIWNEIKDITPEHDAKLKKLKHLLSAELKGKKVIVFTYYKDTARYLYHELGGDKGKAFRESIENPNIKRMDSGAAPKERVAFVEAFAPKANNREELIGTEKELDILISTDVLSEGQNLQDCGVLVNYDLHWNPTRMIQRAGRIDRLGSEHKTLWVYNMFPDIGLERLLGLVESLSRKITDINKTGFLDASILGETVNPQNFNTLKRIREEDGTVVDEQEQFTELASNEFLMHQLQALLATGARQMLEELPDGIHSGLARSGYRGMFFYFTAESARGSGRQHFWRYYDLHEKRIIDNRFVIANLIACSPDTPRVVGDIGNDIFKIQDEVMDDIVKSATEQRAAEAAPKILDPIQTTIITLLDGYMNNPEVDRKEVRAAKQFLNNPMIPAYTKILRKSYSDFSKQKDLKALLQAIKELNEKSGGGNNKDEASSISGLIKKDDLHLICYDFVWS
jgi:superfamily II DNA or RNA helicase